MVLIIQLIIDWLGGEKFDGLIIFNESHKPKNFASIHHSNCSSSKGNTEKANKRAHRLRQRYINMAYMSRLGLWAPGTLFTEFEALIKTTEIRGWRWSRST